MNARFDAPLDATDRAIILATQGGLPPVPRPYHAIAERIGMSAETVMERMRRMRALGVIRRIAAVPNHYRLGYLANGMSVWDVCDASVDELGKQVGALPFVSHCYRRPRVTPVWRYNLFAMVHGATRDEVEVRVGEIAALLGDAACAHEVLYSKRILKKTGMRLRAE
jgi:siroheme decarboxylase